MVRSEPDPSGDAMTSQAAPGPCSDLVERVRALQPLIAGCAEEAERRRKPVDEVIAALEQTGVFRAYVPRRFGGYEIDPDTFIDIGIAVGEACTSTGWVTTFYMEHNWMLAQFPPETQQDVFGRQPYVLAPASISPTGQAKRRDDGYVVSGRWAWGTGVVHADWVLLNGVVEGDAFDIRLFLVPRDQIHVDDTWDCAGMAGTGSNDMIADDVFVPAARSEPLLAMAVGRGSGAGWHGSPCYRHPMLPLLSIAAAVPGLGAARRAVQIFRERLGSRTLFGTLSRQAERGSAQVRLAHAAVRIGEAETLLRDAGRSMARWGVAEDICPALERARLRLQVAHVVEICRDVVRSLMEASGASAHLRTHPMQRIHRDVHTLSCHTVFDLDIGAENYGRLLLGLDPITPI
jgi:alkylation response protein AidB-like acyl-CoA dehydrogenase